jgi:hypothetical protein
MKDAAVALIEVWRGFGRDPSTAHRVKNADAPVGMTKQEKTTAPASEGGRYKDGPAEVCATKTESRLLHQRSNALTKTETASLLKG